MTVKTAYDKGIEDALEKMNMSKNAGWGDTLMSGIKSVGTRIGKEATGIKDAITKGNPNRLAADKMKAARTAGAPSSSSYGSHSVAGM